MTIQHKDTPKNHMHNPHRWEVADATARDDIVPEAGDEYKLARQADDGSIWELTSVDPIAWRRIDAEGAAVQSIHGRTGNVVGQSGDYTKAQVGLGNVDNTADLEKPVSNDQQDALDGKVDKVTGKGLSEEDYTTAEQNKLAGIEDGATQNDTDADLRDRSTHTGTQTASTISDLDSAASDAAPVQSVDGQTDEVDLSGSYEAKRKNNLSATSDPTVNDDSDAGYEALSRWINTSTGEVWLCVDPAVGAANWQTATLTLDELGSAALLDSGTGSAQVPQNSDLGSAAVEDSTAFDPSGAAAAEVANHESKTDPHSQYTTESEVDELAPKAPGVLDGLRRSVEAGSGGRMTVFYTDKGQPSYFVRQPKLLCENIAPGGELGSGVHEAFVFPDGSGGTVEDAEIWIGAYQAAVIDGEAVSQPGLAPEVSIDYDESRSACQAAGAGFDLMTTWDWAAIALWCMANGFQPRGNTDHGRHHDNRWETGARQDNGTPGDNSGVGNILTGSGPDYWRHDGSMAGISDLVGNVWERVGGLKIQDGNVLLADTNGVWDEATYTDTGFAISDATPWSSLDATGAGDALKRSLTVPNGAQDPDGRLYTNTSGERLPLRGGARYIAGSAGLGALNLSRGRGSRSSSLGFRPRFRNP